MPIDTEYTLAGSGASTFTVEELFRRLSYGELSNHAWSVDGNGAIRKDKQNNVLHFANECLLKLHSRFALLKSSKNLVLLGEDFVEPLTEDTIGVVSILTAYGQSLTFGTQPIPGTIHVYGRELRIPRLSVGSELQVEFQHRHPILNPIVVDGDLQQEITLLEDLHKALTACIAYEIYGNMLTPESQVAAAMHKNRYETVILEAQAAGVLPDEMLPQNKFEQRGWV